MKFKPRLWQASGNFHCPADSDRKGKRLMEALSLYDTTRDEHVHPREQSWDPFCLL